MLSVSFIRKTMRNEARGGREASVLFFLCRALQSLGLREMLSILLHPRRENWDGQRVKARHIMWPGAQLRTFRHKSEVLDTHFSLSSPGSPTHLTFLSKDTLSPPSSPYPFSSHCPFLFSPSFPLYVNSEKMTGNNVPVCSTLHWGPFLFAPDSRMTESCFIVQRFSDKRTFILPNNTRMGNRQTVSALFPAATQTAAGESLMGFLCLLGSVSLPCLACASIGCLGAGWNAPEINCSTAFHNSTLLFPGKNILNFYYQVLECRHAIEGYGCISTTCSLSLCTLQNWSIGGKKSELQTHVKKKRTKKKEEIICTDTLAVDL